MAKERVLKPGCRHFDMSRIVAGTTVKDVLFHQGRASERVGSMTEEIDFVEAVDVPAIRRATMLDSPKLGQQRTLSVVESATLRPLAYEAHMQSLDVSARYQDGRVTGLRKQGNHTQLGSGLEIPRDVLDLGSIELVLRVIEFSEGWTGRFNAADPVGGRVTRGTLEVVGEDNVGGQDCWIIRSTVDVSRVEYRVAKDGSAILTQAFSPRKGVTIEFA